MVPIDDDALEDWILSTAPEFADDRADADRAHAAGETVDLDDILEDLDRGWTPAQPRVVPARLLR